MITEICRSGEVVAVGSEDPGLRALGMVKGPQLPMIQKTIKKVMEF